AVLAQLCADDLRRAHQVVRTRQLLALHPDVEDRLSRQPIREAGEIDRAQTFTHEAGVVEVLEQRIELVLTGAGSRDRRPGGWRGLDGRRSLNRAESDRSQTRGVV